MPTNQVTPVNVTVKTLTSGELTREEEEARKRAARRGGGYDIPGDSVDVTSAGTVGIASTGEARPPSGGTPHQRLQQARSTLFEALQKAGTDVRPEDNLVQKSQTLLDDLDQRIAACLEGGQDEDRAALERQRDEIIEALGAFEALEAEVTSNTLTVQSTNESATTGGTPSGTGETGGGDIASLWTSLENDLKTIGFTVEPGETDVTYVQNRLVARVSAEFTRIGDRETELTTRKTELEAQLETASPEERQRIETELTTVKTELANLLQQKQNIQAAFLRVNEALVRYQASQDLGLPLSQRRTTVTTSSAATGRSPSGSSRASTSPRGATGVTAGDTTGGVTLNTASATNAGSSPRVGASAGSTIGTASEGGTETAPISGDVNVSGTSAFNDFSGTTLAISSTGGNLRRDARRTEEAIKKLLRAALSGNYEAIKTCLIMLDKRAGQMVIGMGVATVKSMQNFEKQTAQLVKNLESLKSTDTSYNAKLAKINSEMNIYSMNRQAIANFLQTTLHAREEIGNTTHGFISVDGRIGSSLSRWG